MSYDLLTVAFNFGVANAGYPETIPEGLVPKAALSL